MCRSYVVPNYPKPPPRWKGNIVGEYQKYFNLRWARKKCENINKIFHVCWSCMSWVGTTVGEKKKKKWEPNGTQKWFVLHSYFRHKRTKALWPDYGFQRMSTQLVCHAIHSCICPYMYRGTGDLWCRRDCYEIKFNFRALIFGEMLYNFIWCWLVGRLSLFVFIIRTAR